MDLILKDFPGVLFILYRLEKQRKKPPPPPKTKMNLPAGSGQHLCRNDKTFETFLEMIAFLIKRNLGFLIIDMVFLEAISFA